VFITELLLNDNSFGADGVKYLVDGIAGYKKLERLCLDGNGIGDDGAALIGKLIALPNMKLTSLELFNNGIGDKGAEALSEGFAFSATLTKLDMQNNNFGRDGCLAISEALKANQVLNTLRINNNAIDKEAIEKIASALTLNTTLTYLDVSNNKFGVYASGPPSSLFFQRCYYLVWLFSRRVLF